jgi:alanine-synthesizing transaminase
MFSDRLPRELTTNRLTAAVAERRRLGEPIIDLTQSNPTRAGFDYPADLLAPLADPRALRYEPNGLGSMDARRAIAADYGRRGIAVAPERVVLTGSTSEAYSVLFKLLANAGDEVLVPRPSYPLLDHLTRLDLVTTRLYDLEYHGVWSIDFASVESAVSARTRAAMVVSPNNPTGSFVSAADFDRLTGLCAPRGMAIIADEVFADYELEPGAASAAGRPAADRRVLTFTLGGLSKSIGLPQVKLAWLAVSGPDAQADAALERIELICDTYLSVSTPVQLATPALLERGAGVRAEIAARIAANHGRLLSMSADVACCRVLRCEGGWSAVLQVPTLEPEEALVVRLLVEDGVLAHPGFFFDFRRESFLVVSLLTPEPAFADGVSRILRRFGDSRPGWARR